AQLEHAAVEEPLDRRRRFAQRAAVGGVARAFDREDEILRRVRVPAAEARRLLRAVEGAVDLDRGDLAAGEGEFTRLREPLGIERAAPRREHPAADADADLAHAGNLSPARGRGQRRLRIARSGGKLHPAVAGKLRARESGGTRGAMAKGRCGVLRGAPVALAALLLAACGEQNRYVAPPPPKVTVALPVRQPVTQYLEVTGNTAPVNNVD